MRWTRQRRARNGIAGRVSRERSAGARTNGAANRLRQNSAGRTRSGKTFGETGADGEVVWSWRPDAGVKSRGDASDPTGLEMYRQSAGRRWQQSPVTEESTK